ncbi:Gfo/Idh/MocA family oxidoreductase [Bacillus sp. CLL-7-23]|uniref:Gfo/Idh/MocA family oxidoreductase n=1 Tax=Bacillus changyiensis TaxID=3004103 RepID=A0ABT4X7E4_9BACI|nr:Gfo/Idh/MocA family oxidoreductase [Bacillus changyiensis]MDA7028183.1 Gfo/Idh/MocA family oxidoreductase [Bacillus changyiensis]
MNVLIIGLGYAGTRFLQAFTQISTTLDQTINIAYVNRTKKRSDIPYFKDVKSAIHQFKPEVVVISVNDENHAEIIKELNDYTGFIICEKPLTQPHDDLVALESHLKNISGFCLDVVERYSDATIALKKYVEQHHLRLVRANFCWGKDRINDHRPTAGVISEVIHPLDLVQWICAPYTELKLMGIQGVRSDFSISGSEILDSVTVNGYLEEAVVTGYSSFVNIVRKREVDMVFASPQNKLVYVTMVFDTPMWDIDHLRIWEKTPTGEHTLLEMKTTDQDNDPELHTIRKLMKLVKDVVEYVLNRTKPSQQFPGIQTALQLQRLLNTIEYEAKTIGPVKYVIGNKREIYQDEKDYERLG